MTGTVFDRARTFMYRNARPLDLARFQYHFEDGSKDAVMRVLACYQNDDGGFGHALEPDCWNPNSTPLHANTAGEIIRQIDFEDAEHPVIQRLLKWYAGGAHFNGRNWTIAVESNNHYPHAPWWNTASRSSCHADYNGTAQIAGFLVRYAQDNSPLFQLGVRIANEAADALSTAEAVDVHTCVCYVQMMELFEKAKAEKHIPHADLKQKLHETVHRLIETDASKWSGYVCLPSRFIASRESEYYAENRAAADHECDYIMDTQLPDGSWSIAWSWEDYPAEWAVSKNWWKGQVIIEKLRYLQGFGRL